MTIGIAASGPRAGLAVFRALQAVEKVATGSIGGYAVFAAIGADGRLHRAQTQRGGTGTLFVSGEDTGVEPPEAVAGAPMAAVMSSGPDRPVPLEQYLPAEPGVGMVTGHRLPNAAGRTGRAVNLEVLDCLRRGRDIRAAVDTVLDADPHADAGIIAMDRLGQIYGRNSDRVAVRPDLGHARREDSVARAAIEVLHNAIFPLDPIAALAADIGLAIMGCPVVDGSFVVRAGVPVVAGTMHRVELDARGEVVEIETSDHRIVQGRHNCAAIYLGSRVMREGRLLGTTILEPNVVVGDGLIITLNGRDCMEIGYRRTRT